MRIPALVAAGFLVLFSLGLPSPVVGRTWHILPDGTGEAPTIQAAIDSSSDGDVIELADGVYTGDGNRDLSNDEKWFLLRSQSGDPETCIIDCQGSPAEPHRGITFFVDDG